MPSALGGLQGDYCKECKPEDYAWGVVASVLLVILFSSLLVALIW